MFAAGSGKNALYLLDQNIQRAMIEARRASKVRFVATGLSAATRASLMTP